MKKIVALALSLVMALALCTTAFAAVPLWVSGHGGVNDVDVYNMANVKTDVKVLVYVAGKAPVKNADGTIDAGVIEHCYFQGDAVHCYIMSAAYSEDAVMAVKAHDAAIALNEQGTAEAMYFLTPVAAVHYYHTGDKFADWGDKCGQYKKPADANKVTYVESKLGICPVADGKEALAAENSNVLVDGKIYSADQSQKKAVIAHKWVVASKNDKNEVLTYKCTVCGTVGTVVPSAYAPEAQGKTLVKIDNDLVAFSYTVGTTTNTTTSPKTFDAGIAMYVGMSLMSVAGSAVVIGKKKEF